MRRPGRLRSDERVAIMLIAVFMAIFLVGLLYYMIGISQALLFREKFQDSADAAVLSTAIFHARAMNLLVFINIIMAAILSVLVTVKLLETLAIIGIGIAAALAWATFGATLVAIPPLNTLRTTMNEIYTNLHDPVFTALTALHDAADVVKDVTPAAALALAEADLETNAILPSTHGVVFGTRAKQDLPVADDAFSELCGRAGKLPFQIASDALSSIPPISIIFSALEGPMYQLTKSLSDWFCGDGGSSPPTYQQQLDRSYPRSTEALDCEKRSLTGTKADLAATERVCTDSQSEEDAAKPDPDTGGCRQGQDCTLGGPYDSHVIMAREQCDPTSQPSPYTYDYQSRDSEVQYEWTGKLWVRHTPVPKTPKYSTSNDHPPCGSSNMHPTIAEGYNKTVRKHDDVTEVIPVCSNEEPPTTLFGAKGGPGTTITVKYTEVLQILGCKRHETKDIDLKDSSQVSDSGSDKAPKKVQEKDGDGNAVALGDENFQLRAILHSDVPSGVPEKVMQLALWNQAAPENPLSAVRSLGNFSIAEAEYFYDGAESRSEWMWNMNWRARFTRFRLPTGNAMSQVEDSCGAIPEGRAFLDEFKKFSRLFAH